MVILREQSWVYSIPVGRGKCLFLSAVLFHWKANSYYLQQSNQHGWTKLADHLSFFV